MKKYLIAIITIFLLIPSVVFAEDITPDYSWYENSTLENYKISSEAQLVAFANIVNGTAEGIDKNTFKNQTVKLTNDLDLTDIVWTPIGSSMYDHSPEETTTKMFEGTFDGDYHTINGLSSENYVALPEDISSGEHSYGLFGYAYGANIKNLDLTNVAIHCSGDAGADGSGVAAVIGYYVPKDGVKSVIDNVNVVSGSVQATNNMGGIIGYMEIKGDELTLDITIQNSTNAANVTTDAREAGGIVGLFQNASGHKGSLKFINCVNEGNITANNGASNSVAGGILGKDQSIGYYEYEFKIVFDTCKNTGDITANGKSNSENHAGGLGTTYYTRGAPVEIINCVNTGNITITGTSTENFISGLYAHPQLEDNNNEYGIVQDSSYTTGTITVPGLNTVIIVYDNNGGTGVIGASRSNAGKNVALKTGDQISREGYTLVGWNTKMDGTGTSYALGSTIAPNESLILYAEWRKMKTTWSVASIPKSFYTGEAIKPSVIVYDNNNEVIDSSKYTVTYEASPINVGKYIAKVTYNNETIELDYEIIKNKTKVEITASTTKLKGYEKLTLTVKGAAFKDVEVTSNDSDIKIVDNGDGTYTVTMPNKDAKYRFVALVKDNKNTYQTVASTYVTGEKIEEQLPPKEDSGLNDDKKEETPEKNPDTKDNIYTNVTLMIISIIGIVSLAMIKKKYNFN